MALEAYVHLHVSVQVFLKESDIRLFNVCYCVRFTLCLILHPAVDVEPRRLIVGLEVDRLELCVVVLPGFS